MKGAHTNFLILFIFAIISLVIALSLLLTVFSGQKEGYMMPGGIDISLSSADEKIFVLPPVVWFGKTLNLKGTVNFEKVFNESNTKSTDFIFPTNNVYIEEPSADDALRALNLVFFSQPSAALISSLLKTTGNINYKFKTIKPIHPLIAFYPLVTDHFGTPKPPGEFDNTLDICYLNPKKSFGRINLTFSINPNEVYKYYKKRGYDFDRNKVEDNIKLSVSYLTDRDSKEFYKATKVTLERLGKRTIEFDGKNCEIELLSCCSPAKVKITYDGKTETGTLIKNEIVTIAGVDIYTEKIELFNIKIQIGAARSLKNLIKECKKNSGKYNCSFVFNVTKRCCPSFVSIKPIFRVNLTKEKIPRWKTENIDPIYFQIIYYFDVLKDRNFTFDSFSEIQNLFKDEEEISPVKDILIYPCRAKTPLNEIPSLYSRVKSFDGKIIDWYQCDSATNNFIQLKYTDLEKNSTWFCKKNSITNEYYLYNPYAFCKLDGEELPKIPKPSYLEGIIPSKDLLMKWGPWIMPDITYKIYKESAWPWAKFMILNTTNTLTNGGNIDFPENARIGTIEISYSFE